MDYIVKKYNIIIEDLLEVNDWKAFEEHKPGDLISIPMTTKKYYYSFCPLGFDKFFGMGNYGTGDTKYYKH